MSQADSNIVGRGASNSRSGAREQTALRNIVGRGASNVNVEWEEVVKAADSHDAPPALGSPA